MSVYFIRVGRYIKVGYSANPERRCENLWQSTTRYGRPWDVSLNDERELLLVIDGGKDVEWRVHDALRDYRSNGEWFIDEQGVRDFMGVASRGHFPRMRRPEGEFQAVLHWEMLPERHEEIGRLLARSRAQAGVMTTPNPTRDDLAGGQVVSHAASAADRQGAHPGALPVLGGAA